MGLTLSRRSMTVAALSICDLRHALCDLRLICDIPRRSLPVAVRICHGKGSAEIERLDPLRLWVFPLANLLRQST